MWHTVAPRLTVDAQRGRVGGSSIGDVRRLTGVVASVAESSGGDDQAAVVAVDDVRVSGLLQLDAVLQPRQLKSERR